MGDCEGGWASPFTFNPYQNGNFFRSSHFGVSSCRHFVDSLTAVRPSVKTEGLTAVWDSGAAERAGRRRGEALVLRADCPLPAAASPPLSHRRKRLREAMTGAGCRGRRPRRPGVLRWCGSAGDHEGRPYGEGHGAEEWTQCEREGKDPSTSAQAPSRSHDRGGV